jgi:2,4-dienoyl-CoA reductase-like NADH-dependent reductase (Old Yellow Enzyme family)/thioredoxin reductase
LDKYYPNVFSPIRVGNMTLKNRIQFSPMVSCLSTAYGEVTTEYVNFIDMQARTGAALITIGSTSVDEVNGTDFPGEICVTRDEMIGGLSRVSEAAHRYGAKISAELCHAGRNADPSMLQTPYALAATPLPLPGRMRYVKEMNQLEIDHVIDQYADCTERLLTAKFDMVMIHGAHGNLVGSFLSPAFNHRTDNYGGSLENRMRFGIELLEGIRKRVGDKIAIEFRISGDELMPEGTHLDETIKFLKVIQQYIDSVVVSRGLVVDRRYEFYTQPPYYNEYMHNVKYAEAIKAALDIPVATVGSIKNVEMAEGILAEGKADIIAMARALMCDPEMLKKAKRGETDTIKPCLRCLQVCNLTTSTGQPISCAVSPALGNEGKYSEIRPSLTPKKAVIVGGGVAGMMAAQTLIQRGHKVVLFEQADHLGGKLPDINRYSFKDDLRQYTAWDIRTTEKSGADVRLNTKATAELILAEKPDVLYLATGGKLITPPIPGIDRKNVTDVVEVDSGRYKTGQNVVVCGGGMSGLECALGLAMDEGKNVTVVDMIEVDDFAGEIFVATRNMLFMLLKRHGVRLIGGSNVEAVTEEGVQIIDRNWKRTSLPADTIVKAFGIAPNREGFDELEWIVPETYIIGDAGDWAKSIGFANYSAFHNSVIV